MSPPTWFCHHCNRKLEPAEVERLTKERDEAVEKDRVGTLFMLRQTEDLLAAQTRLAELTLELARAKAADEHHFGILQSMHDVLCTSDESHSLLPKKLLRLQQSLLSEKQAKVERGDMLVDAQDRLVALTKAAEGAVEAMHDCFYAPNTALPTHVAMRSSAALTALRAALAKGEGGTT